MKTLPMLLLVLALFTSCVGSKKHKALQSDYAALQQAYNKLKADSANCNKEQAMLGQAVQTKNLQLQEKSEELLKRNAEVENKKQQIEMLEQQLEHLRKANTNLLDRLSDLSVISKSGAESIKQSLEAINEQNKYIKDLTSSIQRKDSLNLALVMNLKRSLADVNDEDVQVEVRGGVVYVSISDKMLFKSGSADITDQAELVLGKVARVINDYSDFNVLVEGHTDNVPISNSCVKDNWDLSVKRATSVTRVLQGKYAVAPSRLTAGGRSEYAPKGSNANSDGRRMNRRTEIVLTPKLDQFMQLLAPPKK